MKKIILAAALLVPAPLVAGETACIYDTPGLVEVGRDGKYASVGKGTCLYEGDTVRAGKAWAELLFSEGTFVRLEAGTEASLDELGVSTGSRSFSFGLMKGKALWMASRLKKSMVSKRFSIRTPSVVCAVRGTDFTVIVSTAGETNVGLFEGKVSLSSTSGEEKELLPGGEAKASAKALAVENRLSRLMRVEQKRYEKIKRRVEELRKRMEGRDNFIGEFAGRQTKKLSDRDSRLKERERKRLNGK